LHTHTQEDFIVTGNLRGKKFDIVATRGNVPLAHVEKESRFASAGAFLRQQLTAIDRYFVTINPGVDGAYVALLLRWLWLAAACGVLRTQLAVCCSACCACLLLLFDDRACIAVFFRMV
jgi:hypothetical protein